MPRKWKKPPAHWDTTGGTDTDPELPASVQPLGQFVKAPTALARRLAQIGIVSSNDGNALQGQLKPGQRLVSKSGDLWRWDGYSAAADAPTAAAKRLSERNRLDQLTVQAEDAQRDDETRHPGMNPSGHHCELRLAPCMLQILEEHECRLVQVINTELPRSPRLGIEGNNIVVEGGNNGRVIPFG